MIEHSVEWENRHAFHAAHMRSDLGVVEEAVEPRGQEEVCVDILRELLVVLL